MLLVLNCEAPEVCSVWCDLTKALGILVSDDGSLLPMLCRVLDFLVAMAAVELVFPAPIFASTVSFKLCCDMECKGMAITV